MRRSLYRICQEALTNVRKHANASAVEIELAYEAEQATLTVTDNGTPAVSASGAFTITVAEFGCSLTATEPDASQTAETEVTTPAPVGELVCATGDEGRPGNT
mgnify:CR=1 FL=1